MARVHSTARVTREGEETEVTETAPISEVMRQSGIVVIERTTDKGTPVVKLNKLSLKKKILKRMKKIIVF
jgi:hypothetical protein